MLGRVLSPSGQPVFHQRTPAGCLVSRRGGIKAAQPTRYSTLGLLA
jgi:hypothetical protein